MTIFVEPGSEAATHHISLSDGLHIIGLDACDSQGNANPLAITRAPVPRTALKTSSGDQKYSDFEPPWSPISQNGWLNGRGLDDAEADAERYFDGYCANTTFGTIINGPQVQLTKGYRSTENNVPGNVVFTSLQDTSLWLAVKITPTASITLGSLAALIRRKGTPEANLNVALYSDNAGSPNAALKTVVLTPASFTDTTSEWRTFTFNTTLAYSTASIYWFVIWSTAGEKDNHWEVGTHEHTTTSTSYRNSVDGTTWVASNRWPYYRLMDVPATGIMQCFQFRSSMYAYRNIDGAAPVVYLLGDRGIADANTGVLSTLVDATKAWTPDQWAGCVVQLIGGTGSGEYQGWRRIVSNTATILTVDSPWLVTHSTDTEYVIAGSNTWQVVSGHGLTGPITDVCIVNATCYFCQGDSIAIIRMHIKSDGTHEWAADGTNMASLMCLEADTSVWKANNSGTVSIASAPKQATWGTSMTFATATTLVDDYGKITRLIEYNGKVWVMREGMVFFHNSTTSTFDPIYLKEMRAVMAHTNGRAALTHNVYLYFSVGGGLERYYNSALDDVGPDRDKGLPAERKGVISCMIGYPGRYFAAVDAGSLGYSSVLEHNGNGWHELYRAPLGKSITDMVFESTPGTLADRLWVAEGPDLVWLPFPSGTVDPRNDTTSLYAPEGCVTSGYFYAGLYDAIKYVHSIKLFTEDLSDGVCTVEVEYQLDDDSTWRQLGDYYKISPIDEVYVDPHSKLGGCTGRRIRYRVHLLTTDASKTPEIRGVVLEAITRVPIKHSYSLPYRIKDEKGENAVSKRDLLESWAENLTPLTMRCIYKAYDNKAVFIDPSPSRPYQQKSEGYIETLTVIEV